MSERADLYYFFRNLKILPLYSLLVLTRAPSSSAPLGPDRSLDLLYFR